MQQAGGNLFTRDDTFFGVCEAIGQDLGFNPLPLRLVFGVSLLWNPVLVLSVYLGLGAVVALTRWLYPIPGARAGDGVVEAAPALGGNDDGLLPDRLAA